MMEIYPFGGFWAYLKYHYIDGIHLQSLLLIDKTRYDYRSDKKEKPVHSGKIKSDSEVKDLLSGFIKGDSDIDKVRNEINK